MHSDAAPAPAPWPRSKRTAGKTTATYAPGRGAPGRRRPAARSPRAAKSNTSAPSWMEEKKNTSPRSSALADACSGRDTHAPRAGAAGEQTWREADERLGDETRRFQTRSRPFCLVFRSAATMVEPKRVGLILLSFICPPLAVRIGAKHRG